MDLFVKKLYLYRFLDAFKLIGVIFALFFSNAGLTPFEISVLITIWSITTLLTEVPFGVLADRYPRRNLLIIGQILLAIGLVFWIMGGFINFAIGFVLWSLKNTLISGTLEAFVYDELTVHKKEEQYEKISGRLSAAFSFGLLLSAIFGGLLAEASFTLVLIASIVTTLLSGVVLLTIREVKAVQSTGEAKYFHTVKQAIGQIRGNPELLLVIAFLCLVFSAFGASDEYWPLIYDQLDFHAGAIGVLVAVVYGLATIAGYTAHYFNRKLKLLPYLFVLVAGILFVVFGMLKLTLFLPLAFVGIYLYQIAQHQTRGRDAITYQVFAAGNYFVVEKPCF